MRSLFWLLALFAAAVAIVIVGRVDAGYVLLIYPPYRVEVSMLFFALALVASFLLLYAALRLLRHVVSLPAYVRAYRARRRRERAHAALASALQAYYEGRYARAEKEASIAFEGGPSAALAALLAARAAHQMRDFQRRDRWLDRADASDERAQSAVLVTRAELALEDRDFGAARDALRTLDGAGPKQIATTRMLLRAERGAGAWDEVLRLATQLGKRDAIAPALAEEYKVQATIELLARSAADEGAFERHWRGIAARDRVHPRVSAAAARHATELGKGEMAREILERALAAEWSPQLVALYADLPAGMNEEARQAEARQRIESGESWLLERARDAQLLATLGRLCLQAELWGKAQSFLEASLSFEETRSAHLELARLAERLGHPSDAQEHYRRAAEIA
jgi:HemY protein